MHQVSMLKLLLLFSFSFSTLAHSQLFKKDKSKEIIYSQNMEEIETFLKSSHPDDPRNSILKKRLVKLKNEAWTKGRNSAKPMAARPLNMVIPEKSISENLNNAEKEEFEKLMKITPEEHQKKSVGILNSLFNQEKNTKETIVLIRNDSDCDFVFRMNGENAYTLAVPAHKESSILINKGDYNVSTNVCRTPYSSYKNIIQNTMIILNNPVHKKDKPL